MNKYKRCGDRYPFDLFDAKLKDLKRKYELKEGVIAEIEDRMGVMAFWRYSYAARAFLTDLDEKRGFRKRYNDAREYLKEILKKDVGDSEELFECMVRKLVVTHNEKINKNPRFSYTPYGEEYIPGFLAMLPRSARRHVSFFVYVAFKYGHTFSGTTFRRFIVEEVEKIVNDNAHVIDYSELIQKGFVKYRRPRQQLAMFNFVGKCWMDFFEKENKSNLYLYIDPLKYFKIDNRPDIFAIINSWREKKRLNLYEKDSFSLIQVVIPGNVIGEAECRKKIKFIAGKINTEIALGIKAYMTWLGLVCEADEYGVQTLKRAYVPHHEQGSNGARAIGLRLWDLVHFNKMSFADAARTVQDAPDHCRSKSEYRTLQRDYALATACIKHIELLDYSDI